IAHAGKENDPKDKVVLWDLEKNSQRTLAEPKNVDFMAFSPDGKVLAYNTYDDLVVINVPSGKAVRRFPEIRGKILFSPGGLFFATVDSQSNRYWEVAELLKPAPTVEKIKDVDDLRKYANVAVDAGELVVTPLGKHSVDDLLAQLKSLPK